MGTARPPVGEPQHGADEAAPPGGWRERAASAAAVGGAAGLLVLHAPFAAAALAAGAAYATTREDSAGDAARSMGDAGLRAAARARALAEEKKLPEQMEGVLGRVRAADERLGITSKAQEVASSSWEALRELDRRHSLSTKFGQGVSSASSGVASASSAAAGWAGRFLSKR
uniref:Uncharacterized protein n=1 Tax=Alexandrium catenella TaxID=2925 RepID=A0A7S1R8B1_ALECA|mmetsp:Transcript_47213/g.126325  ORF Transcript_47213/g.126325 Transcript_47213/m.126325 type:complete len:171 (+) Transcript_47213:3-515(+)